MPGYRTHLTASSVCGVILGGGSWLLAGVPIPSALLGGALCAVGGLVPDIDSKTSQSFRKCLALLAGFSSLLLVSRLRDFPLDPEAVAMIGGGVFVVIWFFVGTLIQKLTVHRGMCHSIPMAILASEAIFLLSSGSAENRIFNAFAMFLGVIIHLVLDEFYSFEVDGKNKLLPGVKIKKSLGSALKVIDFDHWKGSIPLFVVLGVMTNVAINEPVWTEDLTTASEEGRGQKSGRKVEDEFTKRTLDRIRIKTPALYDLSAVEWVLENNLILRPDSADNSKWVEIRDLLNGGTGSQEKASTQDGTFINAASEKEKGKTEEKVAGGRVRVVRMPISGRVTDDATGSDAERENAANQNYSNGDLLLDVLQGNHRQTVADGAGTASASEENRSSSDDRYPANNFRNVGTEK